MKKVVVVLLALAAVVATAPLWASCDLQGEVCSAWCRIKHFNSDAKTLGCRVNCSMEQASCRSDEAVSGLNDFMEGLQDK